MENKEQNKETVGTNLMMDREALNNIIYANIVTILSHSQDDVEIGLCVRNPDGSAEVKQRVFFSLNHFHRVAELFSNLSTALKDQK